MRIPVIPLITIVLLAAGCIFSDNGGKKKDSQPGIASVSLSEGATLTVPELTVTWRGNSLSRQFKYEMDGVASAWSESTSVQYFDLAEGPHRFTLTARADSVTGAPVVRNFIVDTLDEPAILFSPRRLTGISGVTIRIEGTDSLMAAHIEIVCENGSARIFEFTPDTSNAGSRLVISDFTNPSRLVLDVGFTKPLKNGNLVTIGAMLAQPTQSGGRIFIDRNATIFRDFNNQPIDIHGFDEINIGK